MKLYYFDIDHAKKVHDFIIDNSGGSHGERDVGLINSVLDHIRNDDYYPDLESKLTHLVYSVNKSHAFTDGNKRTCIALGAYFLEINGLGFCVSKFIIEMENISVHVADNRINKELLEVIIRSIINESEFSEEILLRIISAINIDVSNLDGLSDKF